MRKTALVGVFSLLFPERKRRVERGRELLGCGRYAEARREVLPWADRDEEAAAIVAEADRALSVAERAHAALSERIEWDRARAALSAEADRRAPLPPLQPRPNVIVQEGGAIVTVFGTPPPGDPETPTRVELARTLEILRDVYPSDLHHDVNAVGEPLARAVITLEHVALDRGLAALLQLPSDNPIVCYELARVAIALDLPAAAESALRAFAAYAPGHRSIGGGAGSTHTATLLAQILVERGRNVEALEVLRRAGID